MKVTKRQLALLAVARRRLDIGEALWREALAELGGVESAKELDREGFDAVLGWLESCGFRIEAPAADFGTRPGFASPAQLGLIRPLILQWREELEFTALNRAEDESVFLNDKFLFGARARLNVGFGLWQLAYASTETPNATNYAAARAAMMGLKWPAAGSVDTKIGS